MRATPLIVFGTVLVLCAAVVWSFTASPGAAPLPGGAAGQDAPKPAPDLTIRTATGTVRLADLKGRVVLVDFWATWCGPCRTSIPTIESLYKKHHAKGLEVLGVSVDSDETASMIPGLVKSMGITYPVGRPRTAEELARFQAMNIPQAVLVDKKGMIVWSKSGAAGTLDGQLAIEDEMDGVIKGLLAQ